MPLTLKRHPATKALVVLSDSFYVWLYPQPFFVLPQTVRTCACEWQLFLKEDIYQLLECKRERTRHLAALTLQRYTRMFFVRKRFVALRKKIIGLQAQCRGYLARSASLLLQVSLKNLICSSETDKGDKGDTAAVF